MKCLELKVPPLIQLVIMALLMFAASRFLPSLRAAYALQMGLAATALLVGISFCFLGLVEFRRHKTTVDPRYPNKVSKLVDSGIYTVSRNPMYVGFAWCLLAIVFYLQSPALLLGVVAFVAYITQYQILPEESYLSEALGSDYDAYKQKVRRWL